MLIKISYRNLLRNKRRTFVVFASVVLGIIVLFITDCLSKGMILQMLTNELDSHTAHLQIHAKGYSADKTIKKSMLNDDKLTNAIKNKTWIISYSKRLENFGIISSASTSSGVTINGIEPTKESEVTIIKSTVTKGTYLTERPGEILISEKLAKKLGVDIGEKIVTVANSYNGDVASDLFRVVGFYKSTNEQFDLMNIYISLKTMQKMLSVENRITSLVIKIDDPDKSIEYQKALIKDLNRNYEVITYQEMLPMQMSFIEMYDEMMIVMYIIIIGAVLFGIINTVLMSVFERVQEIGVLMSIGMKKFKIFKMILTESFIVGIFGTLIGTILGLIIYVIWNYTGLDMSFYSESFESFGVSSIIYPALDWGIVLRVLLFMPFGAVIGALYPAWKATKLLPTDAMRYV